MLTIFRLDCATDGYKGTGISLLLLTTLPLTLPNWLFNFWQYLHSGQSLPEVAAVTSWLLPGTHAGASGSSCRWSTKKHSAEMAQRRCEGWQATQEVNTQRQAAGLRDITYSSSKTGGRHSDSAISYNSRTEVKSIDSLPNVKHSEIRAG